MQVWREAVLELARVRRQIQTDLLEIVTHHPPRALVSTELATHEAVSLPDTACDSPHEQIWHIDSDRLRQT
jgi:hypothetical protein